jgi:hypothetical protein
VGFIHHAPWLVDRTSEEIDRLSRDLAGEESARLFNGYSSADVPALIKATCLSHRNDEGWADIGYNFMVDDKSGDIYEARAGGLDALGRPTSGVGAAVVGAQTLGLNTISTGVGVLGDFRIQAPSDRSIEALAGLLAWKLNLHGSPVVGTVTRRPTNDPEKELVLHRISGHCDGFATSCPGSQLYAQLPVIRDLASTVLSRFKEGN